MTELFTNPYTLPDTDENTLAPFTGRQKAFEHLYQQLTDPTSAGVSVIMGRRDIGKTALLKHFNSYFDDTFLGVYLPLLPQNIRSEGDWLNILALSTMQALSQRDFSLYKLPKQNADDQDMRRWLADEYLVHTFEIIHGRRLVWLIDDAGCLIQWKKENKLPSDHIAFLNDMVQRYQNLGMVLALDSRYEPVLASLSPLVQITDVYRLTNLSSNETRMLMEQPVQAHFKIGTEAAAAVYQVTGGQPRLIQRFGAALFDHQQSKGLITAPVTLEDVKTVSAAVQASSATDFQKVWTEVGRNSQWVLTAITRLMLLDPLTPVNTTSITNWLIESDFPLDSTTVNAALRSLEYEELIEQSAAGIRLTASLMQNWLLQHAELKTTAASRPPAPRRGLIVGMVVLALIIALLAYVLSQQPPAALPSAGTLQPTLTLIGGS